jgi:hypothetical protein
MKQQYTFFACLVFYIFAHVAATAQTSTINDSIASVKLQDSLISRYYQGVGRNAPFFNGAEYTGYGQGLVGNAFFENNLPVAGWLEYEGVLYRNVRILYDIVEDVLLVKDFGDNYLVRLNNKKIKSFGFGEYRFVKAGFNAALPVDEGFYQLLYQGSTEVMARKFKLINYKTTTEKTTGTFVQYNNYFISKNNRIYTIGKRKDIIKAYSDRKNEIRKFIGENKLNFKKNPERMLTRVAAYYDQLNK